jgi:hypothetical protein
MRRPIQREQLCRKHEEERVDAAIPQVGYCLSQFDLMMGAHDCLGSAKTFPPPHLPPPLLSELRSRDAQKSALSDDHFVVRLLRHCCDLASSMKPERDYADTNSVCRPDVCRSRAWAILLALLKRRLAGFDL